MKTLVFLLAWLAAAAAPAAVPGWDQHPGARLPLDVRLAGDTGVVALARYFGHGPVVLVFGYFSCPNLCNANIQDALAAAASVGLAAGRLRLLVVSIDPAESPQLAARRRSAYRARAAGSGAAVSVLTGSQQAIARLTSAAGFRFQRDPQRGILHPSGFLVARPDGTIARYFPGIHTEPRDLRLALVQASGGEGASVSDRIALICSHFDPATGRYTGMALALARALAALGLVLLGAVIAWCHARAGRRA